MKSPKLNPKQQALKALKQFEKFIPHGFEFYYSKERALIELNDILRTAETEDKISFREKKRA